MLAFLIGWVVGASVRSIPLILFFLIIRSVLQQRLQVSLLRILYGMIFFSLLVPVPLATDFSITNCLRWGFVTEVISDNPVFYGFQDLNVDKSLDLIIALWQSQASDPVIVNKLAFINGFATLWILGALLCGLVSFLLAQISVKDLKDTLEPCLDIEINRVFKRTLLENKVRKSVDLYLSHKLKSPVLMNTSDPAVVLPVYMVTALDENDLRWIFSHEISHLLNRDLIMNAFLNMFLCVFWFNPFAWIVYACCREDWEIRCDHRVLKGASLAERVAYGRCLVACMEAGRDQWPGTRLVAMTMGERSVKAVRRRFKYISEPNSTPEILMDNLFVLIYSLMFLATPLDRQYIYNQKYESPLTSPVYSTFQQLSVSKGVYIRTSDGRALRATKKGRVMMVGKSPALGNYIVMMNHDNNVALIGNCGTIHLREGDMVVEGQFIADAAM